MSRIIILVALIFAGAYVARGYVATHEIPSGPHCYTVTDDSSGKSFNTCHLTALTGK